MSETEQAEAVWKIAMALPDAEAMIAEDARENLGGVEVVSVGSVFAREIQGVQDMPSFSSQSASCIAATEVSSGLIEFAITARVYTEKSAITRLVKKCGGARTCNAVHRARR